MHWKLYQLINTHKSPGPFPVFILLGFLFCFLFVVLALYTISLLYTPNSCLYPAHLACILYASQCLPSNKDSNGVLQYCQLSFSTCSTLLPQKQGLWMLGASGIKTTFFSLSCSFVWPHDEIWVNEEKNGNGVCNFYEVYLQRHDTPLSFLFPLPAGQTVDAMTPTGTAILDHEVKATS